MTSMSSVRIVLALLAMAWSPLSVISQPPDSFPPVPKTVDKDTPFVTLQNGESEVTCLAFAPDGKILATGDTKGLVRLWEFPSGKELLHVEEAHSVRYLAIPADGKSLVVVHDSEKRREITVRVRDLDTCKLISHFAGQEGYVDGITLSPDGKTLATADRDKTVRLWDLKTGKATKELTVEDNPLRICYSSDGKTLFIGFSGRHLIAWELTKDKSETLLEFPIMDQSLARGVTELGTTGGGNMISLSGTDSLMMWARNNEKWLPSFRANPRAFWYGQSWGRSWFSADGYNMATHYQGGNGSITLIEAGTGLSRLEWSLGSERFFDCAFSPDGRYLAVAEGKSVKIWKLTAPDADQIDVSKLSQADFAALCEDLASDDAKKGFRAVCLLATAPKRTLLMIKERLSLAKILEAGAVEKGLPGLIAALDDDHFETREKASVELASYGRLAETSLKQASESKSVEVRRRVKILLAHLEDDPQYVDYLRALRAAEVLSRIDSPEARELLKAIRSTRRNLTN